MKLLSRTEFVDAAKKEISHINGLQLEPVLKWEYIKAQLKSLGKIYGKAFALQKNNFKKRVIEDLKIAEQRLASDPSDNNYQQIYKNLQKEYEIISLAESEGARIRAGQKWVEDGEKGTEFFLSLEKQRANNNTIFRLKSQNSDQIFTSSADILSEIHSFYKELYSKNELCANDDPDGFFFSTDNPCLDEADCLFLDQPISEAEILNALKSCRNGSAPGLDGLPAEVYKFFWNDLKLPLMQCYASVLRDGKLSESQRQGMICLHHKGKDLNRELITNWRPISLTNFDYKLLAKTFSRRLATCIDKCIDADQYAFIKGRSISDMLREIDDTLEYNKFVKSDSIILSIDYAKAFDTLSLDAIVKALHYYGFGEIFISYMKTLLNDRESCVRNGGHISSRFKMERGVRQGCPLAPLLFILTVELLAKNIRNDGSIKGLNIPGRETPLKIKMYADDTTLFLRDNMDYREVLSKIKSFAKLTGLNLNKNKSYAMNMSDPLLKNTFKFGIKYVNRINILGIIFSNEVRSDEILETVDKRIDQLVKMCALWSKRNIGIIGKIILLKTFGLSLFNYIMQSIGISDNKLKEINQIMFNFLWDKNNGKKPIEKVKRDTLCLDYANGGLKMFNIVSVQDSYLLDWGEKLLCNEVSQWASIPLHFLRRVGGRIAFESNVQSRDFKGLGLVQNKFWRKVLTKWLDHKNASVKEEQVNFNDPLFNNKNVTFKGKVIFKEKCLRQNISRVKDVITDGRIINLDEFTAIYGLFAETQLIYNVINNAVIKAVDPTVSVVEPGYNSDLSSDDTKQVIPFGEYEAGNIGRKGFLQILRPIPDISALNYWEKEIINFDKTDNMIWMRSFLCTSEAYLRALQWKIIHRIYPSGTVAKRMKIRETDICKFCPEVDTLAHFFHGCQVVKLLWNEVERAIEQITGKFLPITQEIALFGLDLPDREANIDVNKIILVAKATISKAKYHDITYRGILPLYERELVIRKMNF